MDIDLAQMSWEDHAVKVAQGTWLYDGAAEKPVAIISLPFDYWYELGKADDQLEPGEEPNPLGPLGVLYYASFTFIDSAGYLTIGEAKEAAQARLSAPIHWRPLNVR